MSIRFEAAALTDIGQVRSSNQDNVLVHEDLFAVADGMGGHNGGEIASQVAIEAVRQAFTVPTTDALVDAVQAANEAVLARAAEDPTLRGMGTTTVALAPVVTDGEERIAVVNVGDSRCYLLEPRGLRQITKDHSVVQTLVDNGQITATEAETHPQRNILTRALGIEPRVMADSWELLAFRGDRYLLCSDGLFNEVPEATITEVLRSGGAPQEAAGELVRLANEGGGRDNISVVVVDVVEDDGRRDGAEVDASRVATHTTGGHRAVAVASGPAGANHDPAGPAPAAGGAAPGEGEDPDQPARSGPSFRTIAFVGALLAIAVTIGASVLFAGRNSYFVGVSGGEVVIFQGQPGGFLGMDPSIKERTGITIDDVPAAYALEIRDGKTFSSLEDAARYVDRVREDMVRPTTGGGRRIDPGPTAGDPRPDTTDPAPTAPADSAPAVQSVLIPSR